MKTLRLGTDEYSIKTAAALLHAGQLVAFPTETVYGLGAIYDNEQAIRQIFTVKGRPQDNPLIVHLSTSADISLLSDTVPDLFDQLTSFFFPGPLTLVVPKKDSISPLITASQSTVAIRVPDHTVAYNLITAVGKPLVAPSANLSGKPSPTTADHVLEDLDGKIAAVIDGGSCEVGIESTVLDITTYPPTILRPGHITKKQLEDVLHIPVIGSATQIPIPKAPGMKYKHYSPVTPINLFMSLESFEASIDPQQYENVTILTNIHLPISYIQYKTNALNEKTLYQNFREADKNSQRQIIILLDEDTQKNAGLMNRIEKAAKQ